MNDDEARQKILSRVGQAVSYSYPGFAKPTKGILKNRSVAYSCIDETGVKYWDVVDLIEFPDEPETECMRIGYYRQKGDYLGWGSQTTITESLRVWKQLLVQAAKEKPWFRDLLCEVMKEIE